MKQQTVTRLRGLMENRTAKLSEVLEVERELGREVAELEQMKGEQRFYDRQIALSTVSLTLFERAPSQIAQATKPIADALHDSLEILGRSIGTVVYLTVALVPWARRQCGFMARRRPSTPSDPAAQRRRSAGVASDFG